MSVRGSGVSDSHTGRGTTSTSRLSSQYQRRTQRIEARARNPTVKVIWKLADALETKPSHLLRAAEAGLADSEAGAKRSRWLEP
jgi:hypothetical protein